MSGVPIEVGGVVGGVQNTAENRRPISPSFPR